MVSINLPRLERNLRRLFEKLGVEWEEEYSVLFERELLACATCKGRPDQIPLGVSLYEYRNAYHQEHSELHKSWVKENGG